MRQWILGLGTAAAVAGCSSTSSGLSSTPPPSTAVSSAVGSAQASVSAGASAAAGGSEAFLTFVRDRFPGAAWAQAVRDVQVVDGQLRVRTTLTKSADTPVAQQLCAAARTYLPAGGASVTGVVVLDSTGQTIISC